MMLLHIDDRVGYSFEYYPIEYNDKNVLVNALSLIETHTHTLSFSREHRFDVGRCQNFIIDLSQFN